MRRMKCVLRMRFEKRSQCTNSRKRELCMMMPHVDEILHDGVTLYGYRYTHTEVTLAHEKMATKGTELKKKKKKERDARPTFITTNNSTVTANGLIMRMGDAPEVGVRRVWRI